MMEKVRFTDKIGIWKEGDNKIKLIYQHGMMIKFEKIG
jgi:hypothetical protein